MPEPANDPTRREFIDCAVKLGAGSLLIGAALPGRASAAAALGPAAIASMMAELPALPARVFIERDDGHLVSTSRQNARFTSERVAVSFGAAPVGIDVRVTCPAGPLSRVVLRWETTFPADTLFLGDHWERGYGDLQWRFLQPERVMPWYFAAHDAASGRTFMAGVKTQPAARCFWTVDAAGISLWLDFRNGGSPSIPGDREIVGIRPAVPRPGRAQRHRAVHLGRSAHGAARAEGGFPRRHADGPVRRHTRRLRTARLASDDGPAGLAVRRRNDYVSLGGARRRLPAAGVNRLRQLGLTTDRTDSTDTKSAGWRALRRQRH